MATSARDAWVTKVLGINLDNLPRSGARPDPARTAKATRPLPARPLPRLPTRKTFVSVTGMQRWEQAQDEAAAQVTQLAATLKQTGDVTLEQVARRSMAEITRRLRADLAGVLEAVDAKPGQDEPRQAARKAVATYRERLATDGLIRLLDDNPYGVPVNILSTLSAVLDEIDQSLAA